MKVSVSVSVTHLRSGNNGVSNCPRDEGIIKHLVNYTLLGPRVIPSSGETETEEVVDVEMLDADGSDTESLRESEDLNFYYDSKYKVPPALASHIRYTRTLKCEKTGKMRIEGQCLTCSRLLLISPQSYNNWRRHLNVSVEYEHFG